jgi:hypothetical protein
MINIAMLCEPSGRLMPLLLGRWEEFKAAHRD